MKRNRCIASLLMGLIVIISAAGGCAGRKDEAEKTGEKEEQSSPETGKADWAEGAAITDELPEALYNGSYDSTFHTEEYSAVTENGFLETAKQPLSTFSADVDTASYSNIRRMLREGYQKEDIPKGAVRIEEMLNYFKYDYKEPEEKEPFGVTINSTKCPWNEENGLIRIGLKTQDIDFSKAPNTNLVFLLDVSGSMDEPDKLPLLKQAFSMLSENLGEKDRVSIVTYAGKDEVVLNGARGNQRGDILEALTGLEASGSTNGSAGIETAYGLAEKYFIPGGNNRVILATDGDLNVGITSESDLKDLIEEKREAGVYLSVLGFGTGNLKDNKMETLADNGNGTYAYIDSLQEAKKVLVDELGSTMITVAEDVKLQVEFNPAQIREYRLIGYEDRMLNAEDFEDDTKDAGEIGAGHSVTALYEVVFRSDEENKETELKYQENKTADKTALKEWATVKIRYKEPGKSRSKELERAFGAETYQENIQESGLLLEASAAEFGMLLRDSECKGNSSFDQILDWWSDLPDGQIDGETAEFLELVSMAAGVLDTPDETGSREITLEVQPGTVTGSGAVFQLKNPMDQVYVYGREFSIERKENGEYQALKMNENSAFTEEGIYLNAKTTERIEIDWQSCYGTLEPGSYRLKKILTPDGDDGGRAVTAAAEFEVGNDAKAVNSLPVNVEETQDKPPSLGIESQNGEQVSCTFATLGSYDWSYRDADGNLQSVKACGGTPKEWKEIAVIKQEETDGNLTLIFNGSVKAYTVSMWMEGAACGVADPVEQKKDTLILSKESGKGTYEIQVEYESGSAVYGFRVE